jgi:hypothetical protein
MNFNGQIIQLRLTKDTIRYKGRKGDRYQQTYQSGDITANVECISVLKLNALKLQLQRQLD